MREDDGLVVLRHVPHADGVDSPAVALERVAEREMRAFCIHLGGAAVVVEGAAVRDERSDRLGGSGRARVEVAAVGRVAEDEVHDVLRRMGEGRVERGVAQAVAEPFFDGAEARGSKVEEMEDDRAGAIAVAHDEDGASVGEDVEGGGHALFGEAHLGEDVEDGGAPAVGAGDPTGVEA